MAEQTTKLTALSCPQCCKPVVWKDNPDRPFCSERCRLVDLGQWADEGYRIPGAELHPDEAEKIVSLRIDKPVS